MKNVSLSSHQELEERVKELTAELVDNHEVIWKLRENPMYLGVESWKRLEEVTNKIYKNYTQRLKEEFPLLTKVESACRSTMLAYGKGLCCSSTNCPLMFCAFTQAAIIRKQPIKIILKFFIMLCFYCFSDDAKVGGFFRITIKTALAAVNNKSLIIN